MLGTARDERSSAADRASLVLLSTCAIAFVEVTREGERAVVDAAAGRPMFLLGIWGVALAAVLCLLVSPVSIWRPTTGALGMTKYASHLQYHDFDLVESAGQVLYVVPTGLLFGYVRRESRSLWPSMGLHSAANITAHLLS
jgi:hypothetical protein